MVTAPADWKDSSVVQPPRCHNLHFWKGGCDFNEARTSSRIDVSKRKLPMLLNLTGLRLLSLEVASHRIEKRESRLYEYCS
jgi:hypothetical protein